MTRVVWDCNYLEEVCGACTMSIYGRVRQICSALIIHLTGQGHTNQPIILEPMSKFPVVPDLRVNRQQMFDALIKVKGWVPIDGTHRVGNVPAESPAQGATGFALRRLILHNLWLLPGSLTQFQLVNRFICAHAIGHAAYFNEHQTGRVIMEERIDVRSVTGGITNYGNAQNCVKVCPKEIPSLKRLPRLGGRPSTRH